MDLPLHLQCEAAMPAVAQLRRESRLHRDVVQTGEQADSAVGHRVILVRLELKPTTRMETTMAEARMAVQPILLAHG